MKNVDNKLQVLKESYRYLFHTGKGYIVNAPSFREYVEMEAQSDPDFFRWLFDVDLEQDFDSSLTDEQRAEYADFLNTLYN